MKNKKLMMPSQGFSLVDVMVGLVIAMLGMIIIFQVFSVSEGVKRTTTSGSDAQQAGAFALFTIQHSLKEAGYGIFQKNTPPFPNDIAACTPPVTISIGATPATTDAISIVSRKGWDFGQFYNDDAKFASAVPPAPVIETISIDNGNLPPTRGNARAKLQLVSSVGSLGTAYVPYATDPGVVFNQTDVIADDVVMLKAQYGDDSGPVGNGNGVIDANEWSVLPPFDPWKVYAIRLVIVARSAQPEKPNQATGVCDTTVNAPVWSGSVASPIDLSGQADLVAAGDDWKCYRYKTFETVVPLRNILWH